MADTTTVNYGLVKPEISGSPTTWGNKLNANMDVIDSNMFSNAAGITPIGGVIMFGGATAPANWKLCDGTIYANTAIPLLAPVLNNKFGGVAGTSNAVPNLNNKLPLGAGANPLGTYGGSGVSGGFTYMIGAANLPAHVHAITDVSHNHAATQPAHTHPDPGHTHSASGAAHSHTIPGSFGYGVGAVAPPNVLTNQAGSVTTSSAQPTITVNPAATGLGAAGNDAITVTASLSGITTTQATGGGAALSIIPPFVAVNYIIRFQ